MNAIRSSSPMQKQIECIDESEKDYNENDANSALTNLILSNYEKDAMAAMSNSIASMLDDSTPTDSGVQMLDSLSSGGLNESVITNSEFDFEIAPQQCDELSIKSTNSAGLPDLVLPINEQNKSYINSNSIIDNADTEKSADLNRANTPDEMKTSTCSTFDTENIVYRRKTKKSRPHTTNGPKKRVSFHEDILKNTKTDNIHIEHGFITYKGYAKKNNQIVRYSWCSEGENLDDNNQNQYYFRNACSDVLDYGKTDLYEKENNYFQYDNSGVFEYGPQTLASKNKNVVNSAPGQFYNCNCSSNSSLDSGDSNANIKQNYGQAKSNSCDCIGMVQKPDVTLSDNCYYSEPNIESIDEFENIRPKSVWSKEKKPKSSCLKKGSHGIIINEQDISKKVKTFNVHHLTDMNNIIDNSKNILGSLKSIKNIFTMPLPERGVPEGCEDLQSVYECDPDVDNNFAVVNKPRTFLSKSFDGGLAKDASKPKKYIHNVDEQLRKKCDRNIYSSSADAQPKKVIESPYAGNESTQSPNCYRNKYIINCESTVFEHTGVSYENGNVLPSSANQDDVPMATPTTSTSFIPLKQKLSNIIKSFREPSQSAQQPETPTTVSPTIIPKQSEHHHHQYQQQQQQQQQSSNIIANKINEIMTTSMESHTTSATNSLSDEKSTQSSRQLNNLTKKDISDSCEYSPSKSRHLSSPLRRKSITTRLENSRMSPDKFAQRDIKCPQSDDFDDILTITTTTDSDIVMVDYPEQVEISNHLLKPPTSSKSSLINRFLRNVTQKKIQDVTIKKNNLLLKQVKQDKKLFENIYVKGVQPKNIDLIEDLNAEIALEIETLGKCSTQIDQNSFDHPDKYTEFGMGVGEIPIDIFTVTNLTFLRNKTEKLIKVFKLFTGYSLEGYMTPVLVFLTNQTLYVTEMIRNRLFNKFVLPYAELDVILIGPHGNTVLLSNGTRDMQQVLLAGGPYPADGLVSSLEMCARRGGFILPSIGQLTLDHLAPLQNFVRENSSISKNDPWIYYAVVSVPANTLSQEHEPLGPNVKGPLMYRTVTNIIDQPQWQAGYFLLKAGVLYMFYDTHQKLPSMAIAMHECKGVRRALKSNRPHCFELLLKNSTMQLAAPDEYVASEWLQALVQSASGLFEIQEKHKTLGCTLIVTSNHIVTLREDFAAPLRRVNSTKTSTPRPSFSVADISRKLSTSTISESNIETSSNISGSGKMNDSNKSSPARSIQSATCLNDENSFSSMSSIYGKNSGVEVKSCASMQEMSSIRIPAQNDNWWCILEFSCQEVRESSDDMVIFFATNSDMRRFLALLETLWQSKHDIPFPIDILNDNDPMSKHCSGLFSDLNKSWDPLIAVALGYPH